MLCYLAPCDAARLSQEAKLQLSRAIRLMRRVMRSDGFPETRRRINLSQWNTVHGDRGQLRNGQSSPAAPLWIGLHRRGRIVPPSARRSSVGRDCVPCDPSGLDRGRSRSRRAVANVRWGALNEGGASRGAPDKCPQRVVPAMPRGMGCLTRGGVGLRPQCTAAARSRWESGNASHRANTKYR